MRPDRLGVPGVGPRTTPAFPSGPQRLLGGDASEASFPLGGIGTGNVSLGARGQLRDWEIFNSQGKGNFLPYSFFAIRAKPDGEQPAIRILESRRQPPYTHMDGFYLGDPAGLPRLRSSTMRGEYPFAWIEFDDSDFPLSVTLEAFTPFIPLDADESGIPGAVLRYRVVNHETRAVEVSVAGSLTNAVGFREFQPCNPPLCDGTGINSFQDDRVVRGLLFASTDLPADHLRSGTIALTTRATQVSAKPAWLDGQGWDGLMEFWQDLKSDGKLSEPAPAPTYESGYGGASMPPVGSLAIQERLEPGTEYEFEFFLTWHFPNRERRWNGHIFPNDDAPSEGLERNHYATRFGDAWEVARHLGDEIDSLERATRNFHRAFFEGTLPAYVLDAVASNISIIRSTTCFRIEDGTLLAWEGGYGCRGSCEGSCTHVWNYAQTMAFLFPELERSMRRVEFLLETDEAGSMSFRTNRVFGRPRWEMDPAADGQLGTIVRLYREWRFSGDEKFLRELWPHARRALEFALARWDQDGDLVLDSDQHNTYDIEFHGPNSLTAPLLIAALRAAAAMAAHLGEAEVAALYSDQAERSATQAEALLWNGEYYAQRLDDIDAQRYQYGDGCLSDQMFGQFLAHLVGLGHLLAPERVRSATAAIHRHNFLRPLYSHENYERVYALNDEAGLVTCRWPRGGRPRLPFPFADEVFSGIEYTVAAQLIFEGMVTEGLEIVRALRDRYDGYKRNPWNEVEAGDHYARSLASWGVYAALCGSQIDMVSRTLTFDPVINAESFAAFFVCSQGWGIYRQTIDPTTGRRESEVEVLHGDLAGVEVNPSDSVR